MGSDNDLSSVQHQAIIWTKASMMSIGSFQWNVKQKGNFV